MDIKTISLPSPSIEYDQDNESINRRTIEQAIETLAINLKKIEELKSNVISNAIRKKHFLLMGAKHG
tara:strand:+ start:1811 stop:2011 length:201 start_codon:yes stop_codon:yes gene_type:complete